VDLRIHSELSPFRRPPPPPPICGASRATAIGVHLSQFVCYVWLCCGLGFLDPIMPMSDARSSPSADDGRSAKDAKNQRSRMRVKVKFLLK
jgi:hypothetical protein